MQKKAAKAGFDWPDVTGALDKLEEEVRELREAVASGRETDAAHGVREELGDVLFMAAKVAQMSGVDPEERCTVPAISSTAASAMWKSMPGSPFRRAAGRNSLPCGRTPRKQKSLNRVLR